MSIIIIISAYLLLGFAVGFLAGLFGIGGGLVIVPTLLFSFKLQGISNEFIMHQAIATSLGIIFFNVSSSLFFHNKKQTLKKDIFFKLAIPTGVGSLLGGYLSTYLNHSTLKLLFVIYVAIVSIKMLIDRSDSSEEKCTSNLLYTFVGLIIGIKSSILGIGGGTISIPFLTWRGFHLKTAVSISAALGIPISIMGVGSYIYNGLGVAGLAPYSFGFLYLPALIGCLFTIPFGANLGTSYSHKTSQRKLKKIFGIILMIVVIKSLFDIP